ncbi:hypothetical protein PGTUg99_025540 [Puccinia graminis f. sp. tritici]|uniref:BED-type domain-containing protein n=1 Tax=Puccinia graminis f. sp. tritici TaxID=56615 RepID=A0A5B0QLX0_PUCGR|nr:hypothetical protein PGTUg99_025540 [Puccinia graminis f. sp. tritici]
MKRKTRDAPPPTTQSDSIDIPSETTIIDLADSDEDQPPAQTLQRSWVWNHFKTLSSDPTQAICQVVRKGGKICGVSLTKGKSGSTKNFHGHLLKIHQLADPKLLKKTKKSSHIDMEKWSRSGGSGSSQPKVELNNESLKNALVYFLAESDLPFTIVERKSFRALVHLLNKGATPLMVNTCRTGIANHLARVFLQSQETVVVRLIKPIDLVKNILLHINSV